MIRTIHLFAIFQFLILLANAPRAGAQINLTPNQTALQLARALTGIGVTVSNASLSCPTNANARFSGALNPINIDSGIVLTTGQAVTVAGTTGLNGTPPTSLFASQNNAGAGDADLTTLAGITTHDACILEFDFVPAGDTIKFDYVFASEEYNCPTCTNPSAYNYNCSINDIFAFFISGPGITGTRNIALIPGTTVPVGVSTINDGVQATATNQCGTLTQGHGPYTNLYVPNYSNANSPLTYSGFTNVLTAIQSVTPCNTYHLKLAIADASDYAYDSGVFLKAGSLNSNSVSVTPRGSGGLAAPNPYVVRDCLPGRFIFTRPEPKPTPLTVKFLIQGTAVNGVDYATIPDSIVIPANATTANLTLTGLGPANGTRQILLKILSQYTCAGGSALIVDSARIDIFDKILVHALTPDSTICRGESVRLNLEHFPGDSNLTFNWVPGTGLDSPTIANPLATPQVTTTYVVSSALPNVGCPTQRDTVTITVLQPVNINAGPDRMTCVGTPFTFNVAVSPVQPYTYSWSPGTSLSSTSVLNPTFTPTVPTGFVPYIVSATPGRVACANSDTVLVRVLPSDFTILTPDTTICLGATVNIRAEADTSRTYRWSPGTNVSDINIPTPEIAPTTTTTYTLTGSYPGCPTKSHDITITVEPKVTVDLGPDIEKCQWEQVRLFPTINPPNFPGYIYSWTPSADLNVSDQPNVTFSGEQTTTLVFNVRTPIGCNSSDDIVITVHQGNFASLVPTADTAICPHDTVQLVASGGVRHSWSPGYYLSDTTIANPVSAPVGSVTYTDIVTDQYGCLDTLQLHIDVQPTAILSLPDSVFLYPGETYQVNPGGNCLYFTWFPPAGVSNTAIANPILSPAVNTRYFVQAATEAGCTVSDSMDVYRDETVIDMPNAFAPGYGPNGTFKPAYRGIVTLQSFRIYNRWGNKVFETTDINKGWDGTFNGTPQPLGVFVYQIEATTVEGHHFLKQGNVTLVR